jgi:hypothetical protein
MRFDKSPSIAVLYETYVECAKEYAENLRGKGHKVGVYGTKEKAVGYLNKYMTINSNDNMETEGVNHD